jgi:hypothetical protein
MHKPFFPTEIDAVLHRIFGLQSPKLATEGYVRDFGIKIHGRTIAVEHAETGHVYEYVWFQDAPHLRLPLVRENEAATIPVAELVVNAKKAAILSKTPAYCTRLRPPSSLRKRAKGLGRALARPSAFYRQPPPPFT